MGRNTTGKVKIYWALLMEIYRIRQLFRIRSIYMSSEHTSTLFPFPFLPSLSQVFLRFQVISSTKRVKLKQTNNIQWDTSIVWERRMTFWVEQNNLSFHFIKFWSRNKCLEKVKRRYLYVSGAKSLIWLPIWYNIIFFSQWISQLWAY